MTIDVQREKIMIITSFGSFQREDSVALNRANTAALSAFWVKKLSWVSSPSGRAMHQRYRYPASAGAREPVLVTDVLLRPKLGS